MTVKTSHFNQRRLTMAALSSKQKSRLIVSKFISNAQQLLIKKYQIIPHDIIDLFIAFYHDWQIYKPALTEKQFYKKYWIEAGKLGYGGFARKRLITRKSDKKVFHLLMKKKKRNPIQFEALINQICILSDLSYHSNIIQLIDWCQTKKRTYEEMYEHKRPLLIDKLVIKTVKKEKPTFK